MRRYHGLVVTLPKLHHLKDVGQVDALDPVNPVEESSIISVQDAGMYVLLGGILKHRNLPAHPVILLHPILPTRLLQQMLTEWTHPPKLL
jgi:hypothetical protein